jgi:hypothetical protein
MPVSRAHDKIVTPEARSSWLAAMCAWQIGKHTSICARMPSKTMARRRILLCAVEG